MSRPYFFTWTQQRGASHLPHSHASGASVFLEDGRCLLDLVSTNFQAAFGHGNAAIIDAMRAQLDSFAVASPKAVFPLKDDVTHRLIDYLRLAEGKIFYTVSGAEAVENALKMARQITGRPHILARGKSYHGASLGALSATGDWRGEGHFSLSEWTLRIPEPEDDPALSRTAAIIDKIGAERIACFILEPITGMNGVIVPEHAWWDGIQRLCRERGILLVLDEVSTGFGRTGKPFAFHHFGLSPDFVCMAKAISGGYVPFGAVWAAQGVADWYEERVLSCGLTSYAHPLGLAAMDAVLAQLASPAFKAQMDMIGARFTAELNLLRESPAVASISQAGLLAAVYLTPGRRLRWEEGVEAGLHLAVAEDRVVLAPPYVMTTEEMAAGMRALRALLEGRRP